MPVPIFLSSTVPTAKVSNRVVGLSETGLALARSAWAPG